VATIARHGDASQRAVPPVLARRAPGAGASAADASHAGAAPATVIVPREFGGGQFAERMWLRAATLPIGTCLIGVTSADGGVGRSTLVAALGGVLALAAPGPVLALDTTGRSWSGLTERTGPGDGSVWDAAHALQTGARFDGFAAAVPWMRRGPTGLHTLTAEPQRNSSRRPTVFAESARVIDALGPHTSAVVAELPVADVRGVWQYLTCVTTPLLVARATVDGVRHALHLLTQLRAGGLDAVADRTVLAVVANVPKPSRDVRAVCHQAADQVRALVPVPWDAHLARPEPVDVRRTRRITRRALVELAAACLPPDPAARLDHQPVSDADLPIAGGVPTP
jgi:MinD-like ATPase involved in chromosome partitioning or flagellar assembly